MVKIRFVLIPFSFVFLITGNEKYHIILETLDTEEATYIWHLDKEPDLFNQQLNEIDSIIGQLKTDGRQPYLDSEPQNYTRMLHDYSDDNRGLYYGGTVWKKNWLKEITTMVKS